MTEDYQHTQTGTVILRMFGGAAIVFAGLAVSFQPALGWPAVLLILLGYLFSSLTVTVSTDRVMLRYGPGLIRKSFNVADIAKLEVVRNRWYYGWGIRLTPHGWLFNVSGLDAVAIEMKSGRRFRIGTDEPGELSAAMQAVVNQGDQS